MQAHELSEALARSQHARCPKRAATSQGDRTSSFLRATPSPHFNCWLVLRVRQPRCLAEPKLQPCAREGRSPKPGDYDPTIRHGSRRREGEGLRAREGVLEHEAGPGEAGEDERELEHSLQEISFPAQVEISETAKAIQ